MSRVDGSDQHARPPFAVHAVALSSVCLTTWPRGGSARQAAARASRVRAAKIANILIYIASRSTTTALLQSCAIASRDRLGRAAMRVPSPAHQRCREPLSRRVCSLCEYRTGRAGGSLCSVVRGLSRASRIALCMCVPRQPSSLSIWAMRRSERDRARLDPASRVAVSTQPAH